MTALMDCTVYKETDEGKAAENMTKLVKLEKSSVRSYKDAFFLSRLGRTPSTT